jgi:glutamyl-Q tRNA(Asp) synthetase
LNSPDLSAYVGRFAPSPSGALHLGSLVTAMASFLQARAYGGQWLIRIEDVDHTRSSKAVAAQQLVDMATLGMISDAPVIYQSTQSARYQEALDLLNPRKLIYGCRCSRQSTLRQGASIYPGTCRHRQLPFMASALRLDLSAAAIEVDLNDCGAFVDLSQGPFTQSLATEVGDFVLKRADGAYSYQLAVVVDDAFQNITQVVRGSDLLDNTPRQLLLQRLLGLPSPSYVHVDVVLASDGEKLSKQNGAKPLLLETEQQRVATLIQAANHLNLQLPSPTQITSIEAFWTKAIAQWRPWPAHS